MNPTILTFGGKKLRERWRLPQKNGAKSNRGVAPRG
jgi:hypothetical protein